MTSGAKAQVFMEPLAVRLKGAPFAQARKAKARCLPPQQAKNAYWGPGLTTAGGTPALLLECFSETLQFRLQTFQFARDRHLVLGMPVHFVD